MVDHIKLAHAQPLPFPSALLQPSGVLSFCLFLPLHLPFRVRIYGGYNYANVPFSESVPQQCVDEPPHLADKQSVFMQDAKRKI